MAIRAVIASLMVGAALAQAPHSSSPLCLPTQWSGGYTRTSDTSGATGNVTHSYLEQFFAIKENALGLGRNGTFEPYVVQYIQNGTHTWAGIQWSDGSKHCYKTNNANPMFDKNCYAHTSHDRFHINNKPATSAYNVIYPKNASNGVTVDVILTSFSHPYLPIQSYSWDASRGQRRSPNFVVIHNPHLGFNNKIAQIPEVCMDVTPIEGPEAEKAAKFFGKRAALKSEEGIWTHPKAVELPVPENEFPLTGYSEVKMSRSCVPNAYHSSFYYMNDNVTVVGTVAHNFAQREFGVVENVTGPAINNTLRLRFVQKGNQAWSISESMNGTMTKCSSAPVMAQYNKRCFHGYVRNVVINGHPATETHLKDVTGPRPVFSALFQSKGSGLPVAVLNLTNPNYGESGDPKALSFFNTKFGANHRLFNVPSTCSTGPEAAAEVEAAAEKYRNHLLTMM